MPYKDPADTAAAMRRYRARKRAAVVTLREHPPAATVRPLAPARQHARAVTVGPERPAARERQPATVVDHLTELTIALREVQYWLPAHPDATRKRAREHFRSHRFGRTEGIEFCLSDDDFLTVWTWAGGTR